MLYYLLRVVRIDTKCDGTETLLDSVVNKNIGKIDGPNTAIENVIMLKRHSHDDF